MCERASSAVKCSTMVRSHYYCLGSKISLLDRSCLVERLWFSAWEGETQERDGVHREEHLRDAVGRCL